MLQLPSESFITFLLEAMFRVNFCTEASFTAQNVKETKDKRKAHALGHFERIIVFACQSAWFSQCLSLVRQVVKVI